MTQVVITIMASDRLVKNANRGFPGREERIIKLIKLDISTLPFSPSLARDTPRMIAKVMRPRILEPEVHSPEQTQTLSRGRLRCFTFKLPGERITRVPPLVLLIEVGRAVVVLARRFDQGGPVLLHRGLDYVGRHRLSDQVHQRVRGRHVTGVDLLVTLTLILLLLAISDCYCRYYCSQC